MSGSGNSGGYVCDSNDYFQTAICSFGGFLNSSDSIDTDRRGFYRLYCRCISDFSRESNLGSRLCNIVPGIAAVRRKFDLSKSGRKFRWVAGNLGVSRSQCGRQSLWCSRYVDFYSDYFYRVYTS